MGFVYWPFRNMTDTNDVVSFASYRLAPMRLYTLSKRHFVLVFVVFFICFGLTVFIGIAGKDVLFLDYSSHILCLNLLVFTDVFKC